jgi:hypothetical protein
MAFMSESGDSEHNRSFRTHAAYLKAFRTLAAAGGSYFNRRTYLPKLADRALEGYEGNIRRAQGNVDIETVRNCLHRAWGTEALLCVTSALAPDADVLRMALAWGAVQMYYACYGSAQAVLVAEGLRRSEQHNATQKQVVGLWAERKFSIEPWSFAATSPGTRLACPAGFLNGPDRPLDLSIHTWAVQTPGKEWDLAAKALRSTRDEKVKAAISKARDAKKAARVKAWKQEEDDRLTLGRKPRKTPEIGSPQLTPSEKSSTEKSVRAVTVLDYFYRLRIKANYIDDEVFSQGPENDRDAESFATSMQDLVAATLLVHELRLGKLLGPAWVLREANSWLSTHCTTDPSSGLTARRPLLESA